MKTLVYPGGSIPQSDVASFDVDATQGFTPLCPDELPVAGGHEIAGELNRNAFFADPNKRAFSKDAHSPYALWVANKEHPQFSPVEGVPGLDVYWNGHSNVGTKGHALIPGLPHASKYNFWAIKGPEPDMHPYGACYQDLAETISTGLIEWLTVNGVKVVIVGGLALDYCVKLTVLQLLRAGFTVILNLAATRAVDPSKTALVVEELKQAGAIVIESANDLSLV